jgi:S-adenosylmethionine:tRNA-ribosyltransferase-isomerase (queuine synthetase)
VFDGTHEEFKETLTILGETPLPKHLDRKPTKEDDERFQTIYAKHEGSISAPAAGLHFSKILMKRLELKGIEFAEITLHVGFLSRCFGKGVSPKIVKVSLNSSCVPSNTKWNRKKLVFL